MNYYGTLILDSGVEVPFEVDGPVPGPVSTDGIVQDLKQRLDSVLDVAKDTAESFYTGMARISAEAKPDRAKVTFGMKLTGEAGVVFAKAGTEATFEITLKWDLNKAR
ncbi:CU044_2847 family protein [Chloroflexota bacterium]